MEDIEFDIKKILGGTGHSLKDYIHIIRVNLKPFIGIAVIIFIAALVYAVYAPSIYVSTVTLKIAKQQENILQPSTINSNTDELDRFISNEIEVIQSFDTRQKVAKSLVDTIENAKDKSIFNLLSLTKDEVGINGHKKIKDIAELLKFKVKTEQKPGMDLIEITAQSPSPEEAAIIANTYADQYKVLNLEENRNQLTVIRKFLEKQAMEKLSELNQAENALANFKQNGGIVSLDAQSSALVSQLSQLDAQRDAQKST